MDLQQLAGTRKLKLQPVLNSNHGHFHKVSLGSLNRHINGGPFRTLTHHKIARHDIGHRAAATVQGFDVTVEARLLEQAVHIVKQWFTQRLVLVDKCHGLVTGHSGRNCQTMRAHAVNNTKINDFRSPAHVLGDVFHLPTVDLSRRSRVDIGSPIEHCN